MTKSDLIEHLCQAEKLPKGKAELLVNTIFDCMEEALRRGERIEIRGFGSFEIRHYKPYSGRNPRTGSAVNVKAKRLPFFKVGKELKERVNAMDDPPRGGSSGSGSSGSRPSGPGPSAGSETSGHGPGGAGEGQGPSGATEAHEEAPVYALAGGEG